MTEPDTDAGLFAEARRAVSRLEAIRAREIPFDPGIEIAAIREALRRRDVVRARSIAAELEHTLDRVENAWAELDLRRASIAYRVRQQQQSTGQPSPMADVAGRFLKEWNTAFQDVAVLESRVQLARRLEAGLAGTVVVGSARGVSASSTRAPSGSPTRAASSRPTPLPAPSATPIGRPDRGPLETWLRSPGGITFLVVAVFVLIGGYDRLHGLGALSLWNDEAQSTLVSLSILQNGYPVIQSQHLINNFEPLYPYLEAASIRLFGSDNFAFRLPSAVLGIALIPVSYFVGSRLRDRYVGLALAAMVTFSSEMIGWSRQARWYILLVLLMAVAFLVAVAWARSADRRQRWSLVCVLFVLGILASLTSIGLFLLYVPAIFVGAIAYLVVLYWDECLRFFGYTIHPNVPLPAPRGLSYLTRRILAIGIPLAVVVAVAIEWVHLSDAAGHLATRAIGFTPYPLVWSSNFGVYLEQYYLGLLLLVAVGVVSVVYRANPVEMGLLAFTVAAFVCVSTLASLTNDIAGGATSFERHMVPLLYFLFVLGAVGVAEIGRVVWRIAVRVVHRTSFRPRLSRAARPAAFTCAVALLLLVPGALSPPGLTVHPNGHSFPDGLLVRWDPFALDPAQPSAIYQADQANYQLAAEYIAAHRNATDVVGSTNPGPPTVYLGKITYWVYADPDPNTILYTSNGTAEFFQTGSLLVNTTSSLLDVMFNNSGWLISDVPTGTGAPFAGGMNLVLAQTMRYIPSAYDGSIALWSWNVTTRPEIVRDAWHGTKASQKEQGWNLSQITDWAATEGVTASPERDLLLPLEGYLIRHTSNQSELALATLFNVYNNRPDLQQSFPWVLNDSKGQPVANITPLLDWALDVCNKTVRDGSYPTLAPFKSDYVNWLARQGG